MSSMTKSFPVGGEGSVGTFSVIGSEERVMKALTVAQDAVYAMLNDENMEAAALAQQSGKKPGGCSGCE